jgi:predicted enzyme related to lactoylglutathione lyase
MAVRAGGDEASAPSADDAPVAWHQLHTRDVDAALAAYTELFGWVTSGHIDVADPVGGHRLFAWRAGEPNAGSMANTARWPGVHAHRLFYFRVDNVAAAVKCGGPQRAPARQRPPGLARCCIPQPRLCYRPSPQGTRSTFEEEPVRLRGRAP